MPMLHFEINHKTHTQCYLILLLLLSPIGLVGGGGGVIRSHKTPWLVLQSAKSNRRTTL